MCRSRPDKGMESLDLGISGQQELAGEYVNSMNGPKWESPPVTVRGSFGIC
jgi:hypothetical protein